MLRVSVGVWLVLGDAGEIDAKDIVGAVVSTTMDLLADKLPAAARAGNVKDALLPRPSLIVPPLRLKAFVAAYSSLLLVSPGATT
jgi:hypothetical protein